MSALRSLGLLSAIWLVGAIGCAGAEEQDVLTDPSRASGGSAGASASGGATTGGASGGGSGGASGQGSSGISGDCAQEDEPNDHKDDADELAPARCGKLLANDRELLTFRLKSGTTTMSLTFQGRIQLKVDVPGHETVILTPESVPPVPFVMDATYLIEVTALNEHANDVSWRVAVVEK